MIKIMINTLINKTYLKKYQAISYINKGSFGSVFKGKNIQTNEYVAIKFEEKLQSERCLLEDEYRKLQYLTGEGIPKVYNFGANKTHFILIEELLGVTLGELFDSCGNKFSLSTVCTLGIEMLKLIKRVHNKDYIHRDLKPDNFMFGKEANANKLYLIDFGLCRKYCSTKNKIHLTFKTGKKLTGTARYCSVYTHLGYEQSRRDDLESIGYLLILFLNGSLPWQGLRIKKRNEHYKAIGEKKESTSISQLCSDNPSKI